MIDPVRIETERLILRTPVEEDFPAVDAFMQSPRSAFVGGPEPDPFARWRAFIGGVGHWALKGYGFFMVTLKDGAPVGRVGVINHVMWEEPEIGWHLFDGYERQGYAAEAAIAARNWAWRVHGLGPLISYIHPDNIASIRLAERIGATFERHGSLLGHPCQVYRHPSLEEAAA